MAELSLNTKERTAKGPLANYSSPPSKWPHRPVLTSWLVIHRLFNGSGGTTLQTKAGGQLIAAAHPRLHLCPEMNAHI